MENNLHANHRSRLRRRFQKEGLAHFEPHQMLELLLCYAIPRRDVNPLAHRLLDHFGNLRQVLEAPTEQVLLVEGVGNHTAMLLSLVKGLARQYLISPDRKVKSLATLEDCGKYMMDRLLGRRDETVMLLCLDAKRKPLGCRIISEGSVNSAAVPIRRIVEMALESNATSVVLAHNHPSGYACPSNEDQYTTHRLAMALRAVEIELTDHLVFADDEFVSMVQSGMYDPNDYRVLG